MEEGKLKFEFGDMEAQESVGQIIKVVGVGGCGCNVASDMYKIGVKDAELVGVNTDMQSLGKTEADEKLQIGKQLTSGGGAGNKPERGEKAAEEDRDLLENKLRGTDMLFITCGLGGGTGSGAAPVVADIAQSMGILTVAAVITPTNFELLNKEKRKVVEDSLRKLKSKVNNIIVISNEKISEICRNLPVMEAYKEINKVLINIINGLVEMISRPGEQNIDFEDVKTALKQKGDIFIGIGQAGGTDKSKKAFDMAINNPFFGEVNLGGAKNMIVNFRGNITVDELYEISGLMEKTGKNVNVKYGYASDMSLGDEIEVVIMITGISSAPVEYNSEADEKKADRMGIFARQIMENDYDKVDIPPFERYNIN